ncbi:hypothetical protein J437_LFUL017344 [Ladona fulva]|uniref:Uncharacterized protein n=1 Tax=Ladona fulva TaxID=123851 RepID=A0A8K0KI94_LADFU|nr:hypothetical protein J437_LFUL017344 [Ladona fulva]
MAYVNVAEWKPEQVTEWLKGLDSVILQYVHAFLSNEVSGRQLLNLQPDDLEKLGVNKLGHQELILEAVEYLQNFHYELDRENLQLLALRLSCQAHSLHNELRNQSDTQQVTTQTLADVASVIKAVKPLACWLDRPPFSAPHQWAAYGERKTQLLKLGVEVATCAQRGRFAERPAGEIRTAAAKIASLADEIIRKVPDPLILQPASLELATVRKRAGDDLGFFILPSFHGVHQIGEIKFQSPAHQCEKIEEGDEIVQVNYQTVVGWQRNKVVRLLEESPTEVFLTLKKRPRHTSVYGQIYIKPYRLPSKKRAPYFRWHENLPSPRPELLTIPDFEIPLPRSKPQVSSPAQAAVASVCHEEEVEDDAFLPEGIPAAASASSSSPVAGAVGPATVGIVVSEGDEEEEEEDVEEDGEGAAASPISMRLYLPKPRASVQRRATVTGASPTSTRPPVSIEEFWREIKKERLSRGAAFPGYPLKKKMDSTDDSAKGDGEGKEDYQLREKSASFAVPNRPATCLGGGGDGDGLMQRRALLGGAVSGIPRWLQRDDDSKGTQKVAPLVEETGSAKDSPLGFGAMEGSGNLDREKIELPFEAEEVVEVPATPSAKAQGERARLDKSHSTPAYDMQPEVGTNTDSKKEDMVSVEINMFHNESISEQIRINCKVPDVAEVSSMAEAVAPEPPPRIRTEVPSRVIPTVISPPLPAPNPPENPAPTTSSQGENNKAGGGGYRAMVARTMSRAKATVPTSSPRTLRKRNAILSKGRKVSVKDLGEVEHQGWLQYRVRGAAVPSSKMGPDVTVGGTTAHWMRGWFALLGSSFYGFKDCESTKADRLIGLTGFTVALAPEVKSRKFAFKVYHTGKVFYFAAESEESLNEWVKCMADATIGPENSQENASNKNDAVYFSETDDETTGACCLSPQSARQNISSGSSNPNLSSTGIPDVKSHDVQRKFSSLKKLGNKLGSGESVGQETAGSSLDRKYLRFLKSSANRNVPVPTAKFRSYRRASRGTIPSREEERDASVPPSVFGMVWTPDAAPSHRHAQSESSLSQTTRNETEEVEMRRRRRYVPSPQVTTQVQASVKPSVSLRKVSNPLQDAVKRPCRHGSSEEQEERVRSLVGARLASQKRVSIGSQPVSRTVDAGACSSSDGKGGRMARPGTYPQPFAPSCSSSHSPSPQGSATSPTADLPRRREFRGGSPEKFWINSFRGRDEKVNKDKKPASSSPGSSLKLKNAALYRPPPPPIQPKPHKREEPQRMRLAFEMNLDQSHPRVEDVEATGSRTKFRLFSPKFSRKVSDSDRIPSSPTSPTVPIGSQKTLLGSPRLHRAIFGPPKSPASSSEDSVFGDRFPNARQSPLPLPTMGISMIGKQRRVPPPPPPSPPPGSPPPTCILPPCSPIDTQTASFGTPVEPFPDYPGLEYPPVFEPGTYSLSEASFQRANRRSSDGPNRASSFNSPSNI